MNETGRVNRDALKYIAVFAMLLDHIAWHLLAFSSPWAQAFHVVGRVTAPIMCFFLAQGYVYTRSLPRYLGRLVLFAALAQVPWYLLHPDKGWLTFNFLFTLALSLLAIHAWEKIENVPLRLLAVAACIAASYYCDWHFFAPLWCLLFYVFRKDKSKQLLSFTGVALVYIEEMVRAWLIAGHGLTASLRGSAFTFGVFLAIPLLLSCNNRKGRFAWSKWVFYVFYPAHLLVIWLVKVLR